FSLAQRYLLHFFETQSSSAPQVGQTDVETNFTLHAQTCQAMRQNLDSDGYRHDGDLLYAAIHAFGQVHNRINPDTQAWVEKTPYNEHFAGQIFSWWPDARCIHVVRDPRDNYATYHRKHPGLSVEAFSTSWNASLLSALQSQGRYGKERYHILRYEDLVSDSENTLQNITALLKIKDEQTLRQPTRNGVSWEGNSMFNDRFSGISDKPLGRWRSQLSSSEVAIIETACRDGMRRMGYTPNGGFSLTPYLRLLRWNLKQTMKLPQEVSRSVRRHYSRLP
ncbi:MAG: sulfotransferase, partial [Anaerolineales bacterium]|nr:sulfotransferase [Anaerolineales bacterium]